MTQKLLYRSLFYLVLLWAALVLKACANKGIGPQGGPKDTTPPEILSETPANGSVNFSGNSITIQCNEYLQMQDVANQVLMSPPLRRTPVVKAVGKKVVVTFDEPLRDSTTYLIDFGKAICDLNEKNPIDGYTYAFSTGPVIDTLQMSGVLINAEDLNPMANVLIGLHDDLRDSAFLSKVFVSIARTDENGQFTLRNLHAGTYHIYALNDVSKDYVFQPGEGLAFLDTTFSPIAIDTFVLYIPKAIPDSVLSDSLLPDSFQSDSLLSDSLLLADSIRIDGIAADSILSDTIQIENTKVDSLAIPAIAQDSLVSDSLKGALDSLSADSLSTDTVAKLKKITRYEPSNLLLRYFEENKRKMYFVRCLREEPHYFKLLFASPQDSLPRFDSLPPSSYMQQSQGMDTLTIWLQDSVYIKQDTIEFAMTYQQTDSIYNIRWQTDTIAAIYRKPKLTPQQEAAREREKAKAPKSVLEIKSNASSSFDSYQQLRLWFAFPLSAWEKDSIRLWQIEAAGNANLNVDANLNANGSANAAANAANGNAAAAVEIPKKAVDFELVRLDSCGSQFAIQTTWEAGQQYELEIDSAAFVSIYGLASDRKTMKIGVRPLEEYATLIIKIEPFNPNMMIQVLTTKDEPIRTLRAEEEGTRFAFLAPESYFIRLYEDLNGDSVWTTGDWQKHRQPEPVYYFEKKLTLKANWDFEETVLYLDKAILEQKPQELRKVIDSKKR